MTDILKSKHDKYNNSKYQPGRIRTGDRVCITEIQFSVTCFYCLVLVGLLHYSVSSNRLIKVDQIVIKATDFPAALLAI